MGRPALGAAFLLHTFVASHVCRCILASDSVSGLPQWVQSAVEA